MTVAPADRHCHVVESEEGAAWEIYSQHYYEYPKVSSVQLYRLNTLDMTLTEIPWRIVELKERKP